MDRSWLDQYDKEMTGEAQNPDLTLYEMLLRTTKVFPNRRAVIFEGTRITFSELLFEVDTMASALEDCNVGAGTVVTVCLPNIPQAVVAVYALNKLGAISNMVHPKTPPEELRTFMKQTDSECLLILDAFLPKCQDMLDEMNPGLVIVCSIADYLSAAKSLAFRMTKGKKIPSFPLDSFYIPYMTLIEHGEMLRKGKLNGTYDWNSAFEDVPEKKEEPYVRPISPDDPALYLHSGGTTGAPKIVVLSSTNMNMLAVVVPQIVRAPNPFEDPEHFPELTMVSVLPLFHGFGLCMGMHGMLGSAISILLVPTFKPDDLATVICKEKPQLISAVPTLYEGLLKSEKLKKAKLGFLKHCFCGGDAIPDDLRKRFETFIRERGANISLREGYGLTETVTVCAVNPEMKCRAGSVGVPLPGIDMMIVKEGTEEEAPIGEKGEICVSGQTMMLKYLNDPEATDMAIHTHSDGRRWVHSGDMGHRDADGFFYFDQRIKRIIKVSGVPVFPSMIENVLTNHREVDMACVVAIPDPYRIHVVKAYIVLRDKQATDEQKEIIRQALMASCKENLIPYACPVEYEFCTDFPKTLIGKIDYRAMEKKALADMKSSEA